MQLEQLRRRADEFDVIHFHWDYLHLPLMRALGSRNTITTMHGRMDLPDYPKLFAAFRDTPLVSISDQQRQPLARCNWEDGASRAAAECMSLRSAPARRLRGVPGKHFSRESAPTAPSK